MMDAWKERTPHISSHAHGLAGRTAEPAARSRRGAQAAPRAEPRVHQLGPPPEPATHRRACRRTSACASAWHRSRRPRCGLRSRVPLGPAHAAGVTPAEAPRLPARRPRLAHPTVGRRDEPAGPQPARARLESRALVAAHSLLVEAHYLRVLHALTGHVIGSLQGRPAGRGMDPGRLP